jgi:hypothetical protein
MNLFDWNPAQRAKMIKRTRSNSMILLTVASFLVVPTSIVLLPSPSSAASLPAPASWMAEILKYLKDGNLFDIIRILRGKADGSTARLSALVDRINALANGMGITNRLFLRLPNETTTGDKIYPELVIIDGAENQIATQKFGPFTYDIEVAVPIQD